MKRLVLLLLITFSLQGQELITDAALPQIDVVDENGRVRSSKEWSGAPAILAPMYCRCPLACPMIVKALKRAVAASDAPASSYRVIVFSFDERDTPADLRRFRERQQIPLSWTMAVAANKGDARRMLDAIGYRYGEARGHFTHPNAIIALTPDGRTAAFQVGTKYDLDAALAAARGKQDWIGRYGGWMLAGLLFVALIAVIQLLTAVAMKKDATAER